MPERRCTLRGASTSTPDTLRRHACQRTAALRWLSTAPTPTARTATIQAPCCESRACPTAYTPRRILCSRPDLTRLETPDEPRPIWASCAAVTTPCCRAARDESATSRR